MTSLNRAAVRRGVAEALPLFLPAIPFAVVIGLAVVDTGMTPLVGWASFPIVFAGAAQLTLISLLGTGAATAAVAAALVVNARHLMYSAALAPTFQRQPRWFRWLGPFLLIDQMFALASVRVADDPVDFRSYYLGAGATFFVSWNLIAAASLIIGPEIPTSWNLGFAIPVMFLGLVVMGIDRWPKTVAALVAAGVTYLFAGMPNRSGLLVGALAGIVAGIIASRGRR
jgi:predicted branched-subunit amino acid permease